MERGGGAGGATGRGPAWSAGGGPGPAPPARVGQRAIIHGYKLLYSYLTPWPLILSRNIFVPFENINTNY